VRTVADLESELGGFGGRRVMVRSDLNVPLDGPRITDDGRIRASLPTIAALAAAGARVVVCAHLGRPKGADPAFSLAPVGRRLAELLHRPVSQAGDVSGPSARAVVAALADGEVALLENVRFAAGETSNDPDTAAALAALVDGYVGDAFGAMHRAHASTVGVPARRPHAAGALVRSEVNVLRRLTDSPARPYVVVLGGAKVSDKLAVLGRLVQRADRILVGGGMCFTFLAAQGHDVGGSLLQRDQLDAVRALLRDAEGRGVQIVLPVDVVASAGLDDPNCQTVDADAIPADLMGLDIGPRSAQLFAERLADARLVFWNGPMGVFEQPRFAAGTRQVAQAIAGLRDGAGDQDEDQRAFTVVGGGDSAAAIRVLGVAEDRFGHISTGGGASLEYLEGRELPGLAALA
jgi:phosphoglycerate kinase